MRELLGRRQEVVKASSLVMEGKMSVMGRLGRMTELEVGLVLEEPRLMEGRRTEDQSLVTWRRGREENLREEFSSGKSQLVNIFIYKTSIT